MDEGSGNNYKPNDDFVAAIRELRFAMRFLGIWQQPDLPRWYKLIWYIQTIGFMFAIFGPIAGLVVNRHDAAKTVDNLSFAIPIITTPYQWMMFAVHSKTIGKLLDEMEKDWINLERSGFVNASVSDSKRIMKRYYRTARIFFLTIVSNMAFGIAYYIRESLASMNQRNSSNIDFETNLFVIPYSWYPVDLEEGYGYPIVFVAQAIMGPILASAYVSICNFFFTVTSNLCAQSEILRHFTESITYDSSRPGHCEAQVRLMIRRHQELLKATERLQKSYSAIITGQYMSVTLTICFLGYALIAEIESCESSLSNVSNIASFCGAFLLLIFSYCSVGDRLTNQSAAVAEAIYNSDWYNCPRSVCLSFVISLARAQRPVIISGAGLMPMSLESFMNLIKASASYLSVLRAVGVTDG